MTQTTFQEELATLGPKIECATQSDSCGSAGVLSESCPERTTRILRSPVGFCRRSCGRIFMPSTPTAAGRTIWRTRPPGARRALQLLDWWQSQLDECYRDPDGDATSGLRGARSNDSEFGFRLIRFAICWSPFGRIKLAHGTRRLTDLLGYCRNSANPVGRLVLYLGRCHDEQRGELADSICTGLQLANFWQDVARDYERGRIYLPQESCRRAGYDEAMFARHEFNPAFRRLLADEVDRAEGFLRAGEPLVGLVTRQLRVDVRLFIDGGLAILDAIRRIDYNVWRTRPVVSKWAKLRLLFRAWRGGLGRESISMPAMRSVSSLPGARRRIFTFHSGCCRARSGGRCVRCMHFCGTWMIWGTTNGTM